jgi:protocatechuate 3,4-dioxygenase beta subunit
VTAFEDIIVTVPGPTLLSLHDRGRAADPLRRRMLAGALALPAVLIATPLRAQTAPVLPATPECSPKAAGTPAQTEGPFYTPNTPQRSSMREPGIKGTPLLLSGFVLTRACDPVKGALLDFWQADADGEYDNRGFRLRGHQFSDDAGRYQLETVLPGLYPGRTRHIHVKVRAPRGRVLTTQLYFPGEAANARDGIFRRELVVRPGRDAARFDFVVDAG